MVGYGVASTAFAGLAITMVIRRESGRAETHPRDAAAAVDVLARRCSVSTFIVFLIEASLIIAIGRLLFAVAIPGPADLAARRRWSSAPPRSRRWASALTGFVRSAEGSSGGRELRLPADGDHLGDVLHAEGVPGVPARDRRRPAVDLLHQADTRRDGAARADLVELGSSLVILGWGAFGLVVAIRGFRWQPGEITRYSNGEPRSYAHDGTEDGICRARTRAARDRGARQLRRLRRA